MSKEPMPRFFVEHSQHWLKVNEKNHDEVRYGRFPLGMVRGWIERAESAEQELATTRAALEELRAEWGFVHHSLDWTRPPETGWPNETAERVWNLRAALAAAEGQRNLLAASLREVVEGNGIRSAKTLLAALSNPAVGGEE